MSLSIKDLTKIYNSQKALNNVSFEVQEGEIVGFLGPNGAGKSTTMKIATCFLPPTSGAVTVAGFNVQERPGEVKRITGYLPEHNPLYLDLYVHEYLEFIGKLYGLNGSLLRQRVGTMVELCGLTLEQNKKIETLSKGYRQRVGLAQALIHDPKVLILDEPTSGLDPNQLVEIRKLIKEISHDKTVIFSTHILQEVEALCDRVVVINRGEIVADGTVTALKASVSGIHSTIVEFQYPVNISLLQNLPGVIRVKPLESNTFELTVHEGVDIRPDVFRLAADNNLTLLGLRQQGGTLEDIFHQLTIRK